MASQDELLVKFNEIDTDKNGSLSREELDKFCASLPTPPTEAEVTKVIYSPSSSINQPTNTT